MAQRIVYQGQKFTISFAREQNGACPSADFFDELSQLDKAKLMALFVIAGEHANFHNREKFGDLGGGMFEFKSGQIRMPFAYAKSDRRLILITHGFVKKKDRAPQKEIARAWRIYNEDQAYTKLAIIRKAKT